jgi:DNA-directed RNA polymerase subunit RPC12/RpoP
MGRFRCLECGIEFEMDTNEKTKNCPECHGRYLEYIVGDPLKRGKSWSAKSFSLKS